jgi:LPXTG-motif cell wall-anchored protein
MPRASLPRFAAVALFGLVTSAATVIAAPAAAAADRPMPTLSATTGGPTAPFTLSGSGCVDNRPVDEQGIGSVEVFAYSETAFLGGAGVTPAADGSWSLTTSFPADAPLGVHEILVTCDVYNVSDPYPTVTVNLSATGVTLASVASVASVAPTQATCGDCTTIAAGDTIAAGEVVVMKLTGYKPFEVVTVVMRSTPRELGRFTADAAGVVTLRFTIPKGETTGSSHTLTFSGSMGTPDLVLPIKLGAPAKQLASTGADVTVPLALGTGLVLVGGAALVVTRRRKAATAQV